MRDSFNTVPVIFFCLLIIGCAQQGTPTGGPVDKTPPVFLKSEPKNLSVEVDTLQKKIRIDFDELIILKNKEKIFFSPALDKKPDITPVTSGRKYIEINFKSPLKEKTTYHVFFPDNINDLNEGNILPNFSYTFSTNTFIDSLSVKGKLTGVVDFDNKKVLVGLYDYEASQSDSVFLKDKPKYLGGLDSLGNFKIDFIKEGRYKILAFEDEILNQRYDHLREKVAFSNNVLDLSVNQSVDLSLFSEESIYKAVSVKQVAYGTLDIVFTGKPENIEVEFLDNSIKDFKTEASITKDTLTVWFDPETQEFSEKKAKSFSVVLKNKEKIDTLNFLYRKEMKPKMLLSVSPFNGSKSAPVFVRSKNPILEFDSTKISVLDSDIAIKAAFEKTSQSDISLIFDKNWKKQYTVQLLPNAVKDIFGNVNDTINLNFSTAKEHNTGDLRLKFTNNKTPFIFKLENTQTKVVLKEGYVSDSSKPIKLNNILAAEYKLTILFDENNDGKWNSGRLLQQKQPERIIHIGKTILIRPLWTVEQEIDLSINENKEAEKVLVEAP